jgi:hypothetical protein
VAVFVDEFTVGLIATLNPGKVAARWRLPDRKSLLPLPNSPGSTRTNVRRAIGTAGVVDFQTALVRRIAGDFDRTAGC